MECKTCHREITPLEEFPGGICVDCYAKTEEGHMPLTAEIVTKMWGGKA